MESLGLRGAWARGTPVRLLEHRSHANSGSKSGSEPFPTTREPLANCSPVYRTPADPATSTTVLQPPRLYAMSVEPFPDQLLNQPGGPYVWLTWWRCLSRPWFRPAIQPLGLGAEVTGLQAWATTASDSLNQAIAVAAERDLTGENGVLAANIRVHLDVAYKTLGSETAEAIYRWATVPEIVVVATFGVRSATGLLRQQLSQGTTSTRASVVALRCLLEVADQNLYSQ